MSAVSTYACFEWHMPLVSGCVNHVILIALPNIYLHFITAFMVVV